MVIDEEPFVLDQVEAFLKQEDIFVIPVADSRQALTWLHKENEETFDLILVNTRMPGSKDASALFSLKPATKKQPVDIEDFLQKPFTREQLVEFVKRKL